ncbi:MAG: carbohydrate kinase [Candidatus Saccharicenans sp.]|jgi:fructokinase|nr:carbohydrate kinase [Candidatus Saccharicenans sp.]
MKESAKTIFSLGEILWDIFPEGKKIGGAPANVAFYLSRLGENPVLISRVGEDSFGEEALSVCQNCSLKTDFIQKDEVHCTGKVNVHLDSQGVPRFEIQDNVAWDFIEESPLISLAIKEADAVCFGTLAQRHEKSRTTIRRLLAQTRTDCLKVLDLNLRFPYFDKELIEASLRMADVLKLNSDELAIVSELFSLNGVELELLRILLEKFSLQLVALTAGEKGSILLSHKEKSLHSGYSVPVVDTVGAGDAFTAALVHGLLSGLELDEINDFANRLASLVCTKKGAWVEISHLESIKSNYL